MTDVARTCPSRETLADFGLGKLDDTGIDAVHQHLETCAECRAVVAGLSGDSFLDRLRQVQEPAPAPGLPKLPQGRSGTFIAGESLSNAAPNSETPPSSPVAPRRPMAKPLPAEKAVDNVPSELANHPDYEVLRELGRGGMGIVYLARNRLMDRLEVLKVVSRSLLEHPGALERFQQEIRSAARLQHPNIVAAHSVIRPGDLLVFCMEYVEGQDLSQVVKQRGPLPVTNATFYTHQVALGLQHAFEKGMVHRDIKPNNLMLAVVNKKHVVKILDFGLAKASSEKGEARGLTKSGQMLGTPDYVAPEQTLNAQHADIRADIYSLGCTLYYLLAGEPPFNGNSLYEILHAHHHTEARALNLVRPEIPVELAAVVATMMAKDPAKRYQMPAEVAKALAPFFKAGAHPAAKSGLSLPPMNAAMPLPAAPTIVPAPSITPVGPKPTAQPIAIAQPIPVAATPLASLAGIETPGASSSSPRKKRHAVRRRVGLPVTIGLLLLGLGVLSAVVFKFRTADGVVALEVNEPNAEVFVDGNQATVTWDAGGTKAEISLPAGSRKIELKKDGFKASGETVELESGGRRVLIAKLETIVAAPAEGTLPPANVAPTVPAPSTAIVSTSSPATSQDPAPNGAPPPAKAPFDAKQARAHQEAWARHLGTTVETTNSIGMKLVLIPPGEYMMGSTDDEIVRALVMAAQYGLTSRNYSDPRAAECPQHRAWITKPIWMGATEVTNADFKKFVADSGLATDAEREQKAKPGGLPKTWTAPGYAAADNQPVTCITWNEAVQFCNWLSDRHKRTAHYALDSAGRWQSMPDANGYRLPKETEWEYACRAGTTTHFSFGDDPGKLGNFAWYSKNSSAPYLVGSKLPNPFGLFDMHGNASEWIHNAYREYQADADTHDQDGPLGGARAMERGASWRTGTPYHCRSACRHTNSLSSYSGIGFRVVCEVDAGASAAPTAPLVANSSTSRTEPPANVALLAKPSAPPPIATPQVSQAPPPAKAPFDAKQARAHQAAWAKQLGTSVETTNSIGMKLILIPPGEFMMGSTPEQIAQARKLGEEQGYKEGDYYVQQLPAEMPQHRVRLTRPFLMGSTEVTIGQFRKFVAATKYVTEAEQLGYANTSNDKPLDKQTPDAVRGMNWRAPWNSAYALTDDMPVTQITWNDTCAYCSWLSKKEGRASYRKDAQGEWQIADDADGYRLPTEAEWEYACRAGTTTLFSFGDDASLLAEYGWSKTNGGTTAHPVASKRPNPFGLYDMHGNVSERCSDRYGEGFYGYSPSEDPKGPTEGKDRVGRGANWYISLALCRSAFRNKDRLMARFYGLGFRCVRTWSPAAKPVDLASASPVVPASPAPAPAKPAVVKPTPRYAQLRDRNAPEFEIAAYLELDDKPTTAKNVKPDLRLVELRLPYVYALARSSTGPADLHVFELPKAEDDKSTFERLTPLATVADAGDGNALFIRQDQLFCTRAGSLEAFSLADPARPQHVQSVKATNPNESFSALAIGDIIYVIGSAEASAFDLSRAGSPRFVVTHPMGQKTRGGIGVDQYLYLFNPDAGGAANALWVCNTRQFDGLLQMTKVPLSGLAYQAVPLRADRIAIAGKGYLQLFDVSAPPKPVPAGRPASGSFDGRGATCYLGLDTPRIVMNGSVWAIDAADNLRKVATFPEGRMAGDWPHAGASQDDYVVVPAGQFATVLRALPKSAKADPTAKTPGKKAVPPAVDNSPQALVDKARSAMVVVQYQLKDGGKHVPMAGIATSPDGLFACMDMGGYDIESVTDLNGTPLKFSDSRRSGRFIWFKVDGGRFTPCEVADVAASSQPQSAYTIEVGRTNRNDLTIAEGKILGESYGGGITADFPAGWSPPAFSAAGELMGWTTRIGGAGQPGRIVLIPLTAPPAAAKN